ncbi:Uncharacterized protein OBRU01_15341 [Operophtera brumata]|uniref:PHD-type domain-containing protein n=1 Tax=Operophtera brumata TaxID=104452 RepID=A0A0L7L550_OPEBR|nr:Uncharacterized protein OBRU01_15341 [Operophtera brumata]
MSTQTISSCAGCTSGFSRRDKIIDCSRTSCGKRYHKDDCIGPIPLDGELSTWICPQCVCESRMGGAKNPSTPGRGTLRSHESRSVPPQQMKALPSSDSQAPSPELKETLPPSNLQAQLPQSKMALPSSDLQALTDEIRLLRATVFSFKQEIETISSSVSKINKQLEEVVAHISITDVRISALEKRSETESALLKQQVSSLQEQLNTQAQAHVRNEIEIIGLPESSNENLQHIAMVAAKKLGVDLKDQDVDWITRAGPIQAKSTHASVSSRTDVAQFCRPVVMRLVRRTKRDELLKATKGRKSVTASDLQVGDKPTKVFFNERLTRENRLLFREARLRASQAGYK